MRSELHDYIPSRSKLYIVNTSSLDGIIKLKKAATNISVTSAVHFGDAAYHFDFERVVLSLLRYKKSVMLYFTRIPYNRHNNFYSIPTTCTFIALYNFDFSIVNPPTFFGYR